MDGLTIKNFVKISSLHLTISLVFHCRLWTVSATVFAIIRAVLIKPFSFVLPLRLISLLGFNDLRGRRRQEKTWSTRSCPILMYCSWAFVIKMPLFCHKTDKGIPLIRKNDLLIYWSVTHELKQEGEVFRFLCTYRTKELEFNWN